MAASLDPNMPMPAALEIEPAPTVDQRKRNIDPWTTYLLMSAIKSNPHYENQLYGPWNNWLGSTFPLRRWFMITPQALVRRAMKEEEICEDLANVSIGSTGAYHESRILPGAETGKQFPDFLPMKVKSLEDIREYYILTLIEVKRSEHSRTQAEKQVIEYMEQLIDHPSREHELVGFLMAGRKAKVFILRQRKNKKWYVDSGMPEFDLFDDMDTVRTALCGICCENWN